MNNFFIKTYYVLRYIPFYSIPNQVEERFVDIDFNVLKKQGIQYIITDVDQTIVPQSSHKIPEEIVNKLEEIKKIFGHNAICFLTNEPSKSRHDILLKQVGIETIDTRGVSKPLPKAFRYGLKYFNANTPAEEVCFIGDRIWTDIIGANNVGLYTIKVNPYDKHSDRFITKVLRMFENTLTRVLIRIKNLVN